MKNIFIIPGYGIPKDIFKDGHYRVYLGVVFNSIYQVCNEREDKSPLVIFSGGPTDIFKPYKRTEAGEMKKLFLKYARREFVKKYTKDWKYKLENNSLSTVENLLFSNNIIKKISDKKQIYIFCEKTREFKSKKLASQIFKNKFKIIPVDFDLAISRYRDPEFIRQKEKRQTEIELRVIKNIKLYKKYRQFLEDKIKYFRQEGPKDHTEAIYKWWQEKLKEFG